MVYSINPGSFWRSMGIFQKVITRTPVTKVVSNTTGDETLSDGTPADINAVFYKKDQVKDMGKWGQLVQNADAVVLTQPGVTLNIEDKITFDGETFRVDTSIKRYIASVHFYTAHQCFRVS